MVRNTVKRCIRPQCMQIYPEDTKNRYCECGALLQIMEIEVKPKKNDYKKPADPTTKKVSSAPNDEKVRLDRSGEEEHRAFLYLLMENDEVEFELGGVTRIGRATDTVQTDIDLTEYAGKDVSREHAVITREKNGYYITNVSRNHSVRIVDQDENATAIEYGRKVRLKSEDGILLSKKILLQFVEEK